MHLVLNIIVEKNNYQNVYIVNISSDLVVCIYLQRKQQKEKNISVATH